MCVVLKRLLIWTFVCGISAVPSFIWARGEYDRSAMLLGVGIFVVAYTAVSSTPRVLAWTRVPPVRRTLLTGYGLRVGVSVVYPVGLALDLAPGMLSVNFVKATGLPNGGFLGTLATTVVQGGLLNVLLAVVMLPIYFLQVRVEAARLRRAGPDDKQRGFEVIMSGAGPESRCRDRPVRPRNPGPNQTL